jgi:hypothetical protein
MEDDVATLGGIDAGLAGIQAAVDVGVAWSEPPLPPLLKNFGHPQKAPAKVLNEAESKDLLTKVGVPVPLAQVVQSAEQAAMAAEELRYPIVVKALGVAHKTEAGGVRLYLILAAQMKFQRRLWRCRASLSHI